MKVWNTLRTTYKVSDFIQWQRDGLLKLNPNFQRRSVWKTGAKSYLIDTIIRGLPMPIIFLRDLKTDLKTLASVRDVVDGQQRLRTVISFVAPSLLKDLDPGRDVFKINKAHNAEYKDCGFADLPTDVQSQVLDYQFSVNVFASDTDDREVKQVFTRMNSSGYKLNSQELRNAEYYGEFKTLAETLATEQLNRWRDWGVFDSNDLARMSEVELSSEFIIMMLSGISEKRDKIISAVYERYDVQFDGSDEVARRFRDIFDVIETRFADEVKSTFSKRTMFYALYAALYDLRYGLAPKHAAHSATLARQKPRLISSQAVDGIKKAGKNILGKDVPQKVLDSTTRRTSQAGERRTIVNYLLGVN